jgi:DNA-binding HxlR family transcriptional regulator
LKKISKNKHLDPTSVCGHEPAAVRDLLTTVGDKWSIYLMLSLAKLLGNRARFSEIERAIPGISQRMLTMTLRNLERDGLIKREVYPEVPPRVEYEVTLLGKSLLQPMQSLISWVAANWGQVKKARSRLDARQPFTK